MADLSTALVTAVTSIATAGLGIIEDVVPVAAPVLGGFILISLAIKAVKKFTGR